MSLNPQQRTQVLVHRKPLLRDRTVTIRSHPMDETKKEPIQRTSQLNRPLMARNVLLHCPIARLLPKKRPTRRACSTLSSTKRILSRQSRTNWTISPRNKTSWKHQWSFRIYAHRSKEPNKRSVAFSLKFCRIETPKRLESLRFSNSVIPVQSMLKCARIW